MYSIDDWQLIRRLVLGITLIWFSGSLYSQADSTLRSGFFRPRDFNRYFISDLYSPAIRINEGFGTNGMDYNSMPERTSEYIFLNETTLGTEIPLLSGTGGHGDRDFRFSLSLPVSVSIWFDFFNTITAPILNNDYRFALGEINLLKELPGRHLRNIGIRLIPFQHESTHLGDEITLYRKKAGFPITRVNVSYEAAETAVIINDPAGTQRNNLSFCAGGRCLLKTRPSLTYYSPLQPSEGDTTGFTLSKRSLEGYLRVQYMGSDGPLRIGRFYPVVSAEFRYRVKFGYPYYEPDPDEPMGFREVVNPEKYVPCLNLFAGWRYRGRPSEPGQIGGYFRFYTGSNPHGQFRNIPRYSYFGVVLVYEH